MDRLPGYHKSRCEGLTLLASTVLNTRSVNLMEFAAALPGISVLSTIVISTFRGSWAILTSIATM